jgi:hypothetical protein
MAMTLFTTPKPFRGHTGVIQGNAIRSWTLLRPSCNVVLLGDEEGTAQLASALGIRHLPQVERNEFGMPLIRSLFTQAEAVSETPLLCYANADIIFMSDVVAAAQRAAAWHPRFLLVGQRFDADVKEPLEFAPGWEERLRGRVIQGGCDLSFGMDYFVFPRGLWAEIPPALAVGRAGWDNWPVFDARSHRTCVIDATQVVMAVHQRHDYSHHPEGRKGVYDGLEAERNYQALGGAHNVFTILEATHLLTAHDLKVRCRSCYPACACRPHSF